MVLSDLIQKSYNNFGLGENRQARLFEPDAIKVTTHINSRQLKSLVDATVNNTSIDNLQIGIDEAGRGPLLGSVVVSAVMLPLNLSGLFSELDLSNTPISIINDSKKISEKKRETLFDIIPKVAIGYSIVEVPASVIDEINILQASLLGMRIAGDELLAALMSDASMFALLTTNQPICFLYDGNKLPQVDTKFYQKLGLQANQITQQAIVKGDATDSSIAAASILAKVSRDALMYELAKKHPDYKIEKHKGYPTKAHIAAIQKHGVLAEHRRSFAPVKRVIEAKRVIKA